MVITALRFTRLTRRISVFAASAELSGWNRIWASMLPAPHWRWSCSKSWNGCGHVCIDLKASPGKRRLLNDVSERI